MVLLATNSWQDFEAWWGTLSPTLQILYAVLAIIIVVCVFIVTIELLKLVFLLVYYILYGTIWLVYQILKATFYLVVVILYTVFGWIFVAPCLIIFRNKRVSEVSAGYRQHIKNFTNALYGEKKPVAVNNNTQTVSVQGNQQTTVQTMPSPTHIRVIQLPTTTKQSESIVFHCTNCGAEFTPLMNNILNKNHNAFCEHCGQAYAIQGNVPYPIQG